MGSAKALHLEKEIGNLKVGYIADVIAIDLKSTDVITQRADLAIDIWEAIFPTLMMGDDRAIAATFIAGDLIHSKKM